MTYILKRFSNVCNINSCCYWWILDFHFHFQVCLGLRFLASGAIYSACGDTQGVDKGTVCRSVWPLVHFLNSIAHR